MLPNLIDARFRRALVNSGNSRLIRGGEGRLSRHLFAIFLYENPGAHKIWENQRTDELEMLQMLSPDITFINDFANSVREDMKKLDQGKKLGES